MSIEIKEPYIGPKGYTIYKESISVKEQISIRNELTVKPYLPKSPIQPQAFPLYRESVNKFYVPRYFGIKHFGYPKNIRINNGKNINLKFKGELRDYQNSIVDTYIKYIGLNDENSLDDSTSK